MFFVRQYISSMTMTKTKLFSLSWFCITKNNIGERVSFHKLFTSCPPPYSVHSFFTGSVKELRMDKRRSLFIQKSLFSYPLVHFLNSFYNGVNLSVCVSCSGECRNLIKDAIFLWQPKYLYQSNNQSIFYRFLFLNIVFIFCHTKLRIFWLEIW